MTETTLILGGGIGGIAAANMLSRHLRGRHRIIVVDREAQFRFAPSFLWVVSGIRRPEQVARPLAGLERKGIEVVHGEIEGVDPRRREAVVNGLVIAADYVVVALGAVFAPETIAGLADYGQTFVTLDGAVRLGKVLEEMRRGRIVIVTAAPAYKCPAAPYEAALLVDGIFRRRGLRDTVQIELHTAEPGPMGVAGPKVSAAVRAMVEARGIGYHPAHQIARAEEHRAVFTDGASIDFDLLVYMPPIRPPLALAGSGLTDEAGWVQPDRHTLETRHPRVYAVGDVTLIPLAMGKPLPKAGVFAHAQAEVVARSIAMSVQGKPSSERFDGHGSCFVETGGGRAGIGAGDFYAEPLPRVHLRRPSRFWHAAKALFEKQVMRRWI